MEAIVTKQLLLHHYKLGIDTKPQKRIKSEWEAENKLGFLLGVIEHGFETHITWLHCFLSTNHFAEHEMQIIDDLFFFYIAPFHRDFNYSYGCYSSTPSSNGQFKQEGGVVSGLTHGRLKKAVMDRDKVCLFCWYRSPGCLKSVHIIALDIAPITSVEPSLLECTGMKEIHQVQNGMLLCLTCHAQFGTLKQYVDVVDDKLVVKVVDYSVFWNDEKHREWNSHVRMLKLVRSGLQEDWTDIDDKQHKEWEETVETIKGGRFISQTRWTDRQAVEPNGEMALYFIDTTADQLPNRDALKFHKIACLIWRMAGGLESDYEYCSCCSDMGPVDTFALKRRFKINVSAEL